MESYFGKRLSYSTISPRSLVKVFNFFVAVSLVLLEIFLNLLAIGTAINALIFLIVATSPLWILLLIFWWPMILALAFLIKFTSIRTYLIQFFTQYAKYVLYNY